MYVSQKQVNLLFITSSSIEKGDWPVIEKVFESYVTKYNPNDKSQVDSTDTFLNTKYVRPMTVLAGSFAERGSGLYLI